MLLSSSIFDTDDERAIYNLKGSKQPPCTIPYVVSSVPPCICICACHCVYVFGGGGWIHCVCSLF